MSTPEPQITTIRQITPQAQMEMVAFLQPWFAAGRRGADGIRFDTKPQDGDWLYIETTSTTGVPPGFGASLWMVISEDFRLEIAQDWNIESIGRDLNLNNIMRDFNCNIGNDFNIAIGNDYNIQTGRNFNIAAVGAVSITTQDTTNGFEVDLGVVSTPGVPFRIRDHSGNILMEFTG